MSDANKIFVCNGCKKLHLSYQTAIFQRQFMGMGSDGKFQLFTNGIPQDQYVAIGEWRRTP